MDQEEQDRRALEVLEDDTAELERMEELSNQFNIFEAVGFTNQEERHSNFLAFLLKPRADHGLGDLFAKRLLKQVLQHPDAPAFPSPLEVESWDLGEVSILREWKRIDILLLDKRNRLAVIIENKIWTDEHSGQLTRYHNAIRQRYPDYWIVALYLSPFGGESSHPAYLPVSYRTVCEILEEFAESRESVLNAEASTLITHYTRMLRRHIVGDSEIVRLSRQIYRKHQRALDLLYKHLPDPRKETFDVLTSLIKDESRLTYKNGTADGAYIWFRPREWKGSNLDKSSEPNGFVSFQFINRPDELYLRLHVRPGDDVKRQKLYEMALKYESLFRDWEIPEQGREMKFYGRTFLTPQFCEDATDEERERQVRKQWKDFLENDLPRINAALRQEAWIWELEGSEDHSGASERFVWGDGDISFRRKPDEDRE